MEKYAVMVNAFEAGMLMGLIWNSERRNYLMNIFQQLKELNEKFKNEAGVKIEKLSNGSIRLTDNHGFIITRERYEWE